MDDSPKTPRPASNVALDWAAGTDRVPALLNELAIRARRRRFRRIRLVAAGCAVVLLGAAVVWAPLSLSDHAPEPSRIVVSEPRRQTLPDGSRVELRDDAEIAVDFSGPLRRVTLTRGEVHFQVAKDPDRPFVVVAPGVDVRAVGTAFSVQLKAAAVEVHVTEGRVAVAQSVVHATIESTPAPAATLVDAGQLAVVAASAPEVTALSAAESSERLMWRVSRIEFSSTPLVEAVALLNRQSAVQLSLGDDSLAALRISGIVRADNAEALVRLLVANYEVNAARESERSLVLRRR